MTTDSLVDHGISVFANNYGPGKIAITDGEGARVRDENGKQYIDLGTGISVTSFGHRPKEIADAIHAQVDLLWHTSNLYYNEPAVKLAEELVASSFAERVFFCNSGAEANEAAIKTVRKAASATRAPEKRTILTFEGGFHGRTLAAITATAQPKYQEGFEPLPGGFKYCEYNNVDALNASFDDTVCAVIVEPIQGEGGIHIADDEFMRALRDLCKTNGAYLVVDEVQSGMGRSGKLWAHQWYESVTPDAMTSAKALGAGLPIGALMLGERLADTLQPGSHGSTFGGNPICCSAARVALRLAQDPALVANVGRQSERLKSGLESISNELSVFQDIRGRGLMIGAQLTDDLSAHIGQVVDGCRDGGVLVLSAGGGVLRLLPPLVLTDDDVDQSLTAIHESLKSVVADHR